MVTNQLGGLFVNVEFDHFQSLHWRFETECSIAIYGINTGDNASTLCNHLVKFGAVCGYWVKFGLLSPFILLTFPDALYD